MKLDIQFYSKDATWNIIQLGMKTTTLQYELKTTLKENPIKTILALAIYFKTDYSEEINIKQNYSGNLERPNLFVPKNLIDLVQWENERTSIIDAHYGYTATIEDNKGIICLTIRASCS